MGIDPDRTFQPVGIVVLVVSDTRTLDTDSSGRWLEDALVGVGHRLVERVICPDDQAEIEARLRGYIDDDRVQVVLATGGTGITARDVTPEAFHAVYDKEIPGFGELFRFLSYRTIGTSTVQSRATAGVAGGTLLFALPGSRGAVADAWNEILVSQLDARHRPCNFIELLPRIDGRARG